MLFTQRKWKWKRVCWVNAVGTINLLSTWQKSSSLRCTGFFGRTLANATNIVVSTLFCLPPRIKSYERYGEPASTVHDMIIVNKTLKVVRYRIYRSSGNSQQVASSNKQGQTVWAVSNFAIQTPTFQNSSERPVILEILVSVTRLLANCPNNVPREHPPNWMRKRDAPEALQRVR